MERNNELDLFIFDCDGVLVDSEFLVSAVVGEELTRLGFPITAADVIRRFAGRPAQDTMDEVARDWGQPIPDEYFTASRRRIDHMYRNELEAVRGTLEVLPRLTIARCVASSSAPGKLAQGLRHTGLHDIFAPNIISTHAVAQGKPQPDIFVFAAGWMHTPVHRCLVIEDSAPGVRAARRAGMRVFGLTAGRHCQPGHTEVLLEAGAELVMDGIEELESLVPEAFASRT